MHLHRRLRLLERHFVMLTVLTYVCMVSVRTFDNQFENAWCQFDIAEPKPKSSQRQPSMT